jgi:citrate lyase subunit beta / citryl-CoA lyase
MAQAKRPLITLYTPGNRLDLIEKAARFEPDGIVIDFEDAVPIHMKAQVRQEVSEFLPRLETMALVRVNSEPQFLEDDLTAVVSKHIYGVGLPMAETVEQVENADRIITGLERERGLEPDSIKLLLLIETAKGVAKCFDVCSAAKRVESVIFGSAEDGDLQRDLHCAFSVDGPEINYSRSRVLLEARAAGLPYVLDGAWSGVQDLEGLRAECTISKRIGYDGRTLIYPKHIPIAREAYAPNPDEIAYYTRLLEAFQDAEKKGLAAITFEGKLVDYAMYKKAKLFLGE